MKKLFLITCILVLNVINGQTISSITTNVRNTAEFKSAMATLNNDGTIILEENTIVEVNTEFSLLIPKGITVKIEKGSGFNVHARISNNVINPFRLEVYGEIDAGLYQVFYSDSNIRDRVAGKIIGGKVYPEWFGAFTNDDIDDTVAIQKAINFFAISDDNAQLQIKGGTVVFSAGEYHINQTLDLKTFNVTLFGSSTTTGAKSIIISNVPLNPMLHIDAPEVSITGIFFKNNGIQDDSVGILFNRDVTTRNISNGSSGDIDCRIINSRFESLDTCIKAYGRNLKVINSTFSKYILGIDLNITDDHIATNEASKTNTAITHTIYPAVDNITLPHNLFDFSEVIDYTVATNNIPIKHNFNFAEGESYKVYIYKPSAQNSGPEYAMAEKAGVSYIKYENINSLGQYLTYPIMYSSDKCNVSDGSCYEQGFRGFEFIENRFHAGDVGIQNIGVGAQYLHGCRISNNTYDTNGSFFHGSLSESIISDNIIHRLKPTSDPVVGALPYKNSGLSFKLAKNLLITGNYIGGEQDVNGNCRALTRASYGIYFKGYAENCIINSNSFANIDINPIRFIKGGKDITITGNTFRKFNNLGVISERRDAAIVIAPTISVSINGTLLTSLDDDIFTATGVSLQTIVPAGMNKFSVIDGGKETIWSSSSFPDGTASPNGDAFTALEGIYHVSFTKSTGEYEFTPEIVRLTGDGLASVIPFLSTDDDTYTASGLVLVDGGVQFIVKDNGVETTWGLKDFPDGTALDNEQKIEVLQGTYDVSFTKSTGVYQFTVVNPPTTTVETDSKNFIIDANKFIGCSDNKNNNGISFDIPVNNISISNNIFNNLEKGINIGSSSNYCSITNNTFSDILKNSIVFENYVNDVQIQSNRFKNSYDGITFKQKLNNTQISDNNFTNIKNTALLFEKGTNNVQIQSNKFTVNEDYTNHNSIIISLKNTIDFSNYNIANNNFAFKNKNVPYYGKAIEINSKSKNSIISTNSFKNYFRCIISNNTVNNLDINSNNFENSIGAIFFQKESDNLQLSNNHFKDVDKGIYLIMQNKNSSFLFNNFTNMHRGIYFVENAIHTQINGNKFSDIIYNSIFLNKGVSHAQIQSNSFNQEQVALPTYILPNQSCIKINSNDSNTKNKYINISSNNFMLSTSDQNKGIEFGSKISDVIIRDNLFNNNSDTSPGAKWFDNWIVINNKIDNQNQPYSSSYDGTYTGANNLQSKNIGYSDVPDIVLIIPNSRSIPIGIIGIGERDTDDIIIVDHPVWRGFTIKGLYNLPDSEYTFKMFKF